MPRYREDDDAQVSLQVVWTKSGGIEELTREIRGRALPSTRSVRKPLGRVRHYNDVVRVRKRFGDYERAGIVFERNVRYRYRVRFPVCSGRQSGVLTTARLVTVKLTPPDARRPIATNCPRRSLRRLRPRRVRWHRVRYFTRPFAT